VLGQRVLQRIPIVIGTVHCIADDHPLCACANTDTNTNTNTDAGSSTNANPDASALNDRAAHSAIQRTGIHGLGTESGMAVMQLAGVRWW